MNFDPYAEFGAWPDVVADVQADLVGAFWSRHYRPGISDVVEVVNHCSEELILPGGHVATVLRRLGFAEEAAAYIEWSIRNGRANDGRKRAGRASSLKQNTGALAGSTKFAKIRRKWKKRPAG